MCAIRPALILRQRERRRGPSAPAAMSRTAARARARGVMLNRPINNDHPPWADAIRAILGDSKARRLRATAARGGFPGPPLETPARRGSISPPAIPRLAATALIP